MTITDNSQTLYNALKRIDELEYKLKHRNLICPECLHSAYDPCEPDTPGAVPDEQGDFVRCQVCELKAELVRLWTRIFLLDSSLIGDTRWLLPLSSDAQEAAAWLVRNRRAQKHEKMDWFQLTSVAGKET